MPRPLSDQDTEVVLEAERDIRSRLGDRPLDFEALLAVSNICRAATAVRNRMEREVLGPAGLSWGWFTILFVLWVWGDGETGALAEDCGLAKGTLSGKLTTLERSGLVTRSRHPGDGRKVMVGLEPAGLDKIEEVVPIFNRHETMFTANLSSAGHRQLARLLGTVTDTAGEVELVGDDAGSGQATANPLES